MSLDLFQTGVYCRVPGGGPGEDVQGMRAAGMKWAVLNCGRDPGVEENPAVWKERRAQYTAAGIPHGPWRHCSNFDQIKMIVATAVEWDSPLVGVNLEDVYGEGQDLAQIGAYLRAEWVEKYRRPVHMATLPWVQNGQGWRHVAFAYAALEMFPEEIGPWYLDRYQQCIDHAFEEGLVRVTLLDSVLSPRSVYPNVAHCIYTADNVGSWSEWRDTAPQEIPLPPGGGSPPVPPDPEDPWYLKPYLTGPPVGPEKLPRPLKPPKNNGGVALPPGDDVMAYKRGISRAGRWKPWSPSTWSYVYGDAFALGEGKGQVPRTGVRGFQRQHFPNDETMHTGNLGDKTYQAMRRALVSDPDSPHYREPIFDSTAVKLLKQASQEYQKELKEEAFRDALAEFCSRAELASSEAWTYSQARPYTGLGVAPEKAHRNDCSSYVILAYFWAREKSGLKVPDPSGYQYDGYGNTWDDLDGNPRVSNGSYLVGDCANYDGHVTVCTKPGNAQTSRWSSFGSEPRPKELDLYYRGDLISVTRPPLY